MLRWSWRCLDYTGSSVYREFLVKYQGIPTYAPRPRQDMAAWAN